MRRIGGVIKKLNGKQIMVLALCFAFILTTVAGVIGNGELNVGHKSADLDEKSMSMMQSDSMVEEQADSFPAEENFNSRIEYVTEGNGSADDDRLVSDTTSSFSWYSGTPLKDDVFKPAVNRVVTKKATLYAETENYENLAEFIGRKVKELDGYVESSNEYDYEGKAGRSGFMTIRIPADDLETFITSVESEATIRTKNLKSDDITSNYVDTESKISALQGEQGTLLNLLSKAQSLSDTIEIQDRLTEVRSELEYYYAMKLRMESEVQYSSVYIDIKEVDRESDSGSGFWHDVKNGFIDSLYNVAKGFKIMTIWFVSALPFVAILIACGIIVKGIVKVFKKRKSDRGEHVAESDGGQTDS